ncbi:MAG TPA: hypothetical protein VGG30_08165 [Pirellulales bacterium]|jgi:hypothetical protein
MATHTENPLEAFVWTPQPEAAQFVDQLVASFCAACPPAARLAQRMLDETGTRLIDWIDHLGLAESAANERKLRELGFEPGVLDGHRVWQHPLALFPTIHFYRQAEAGMGLRVESVADFLVAQGLESTQIEGAPLAAVRKSRLFSSPQAELWVIERHSGHDSPAGGDGAGGHAGGRRSPQVATDTLRAVLEHGEAFRRRARHFDSEEQGFDHAEMLIERAIADLGVNRACDLFFAAEREYWQRRNRAGQVQKARQDALGLGWANHDHHTYRSSREHFTRLIGLFEQLGFQCRERFYGGREAGWGAQVIEQPACGVVIFADVDLSPAEVTGDFAHQPLPPRDQLGTVGLWCRLHGEAFLAAGMHHLECRFDFDSAREQLLGVEVESMKPFTDFAFLRQAFTRADTWPVEARRIDSALADGLISPEQAERFRREGALGSHLEVLERNQGYKGFNQTGISEIIRETDPRTAGRV